LLSNDDANNMIHRFVGAGLRKCSRQFKTSTITGKRKFKVSYSKDVSSEAESIVALMILEDHHQAASDMNYVENYYPTSIQLLNQGGFLLLRKEFFPWATILIEAIRSAFTDDIFHRHKKEAINVGRKLVLGNASMYKNFEKTVIGIQGADVSFSHDAIAALHTELAGYCLEAYTGDKFKEMFNKNKRKAGDTSKVAHRPKMQLVNGQSDGGGVISKKRERGVAKESKHKKEYSKILDEALKTLQTNSFDPTKLRKKADCCAVLYCCYGVYHDQTSSKPSQKLSNLQGYLSKAIMNDKSKLSSVAVSSTTSAADTCCDPEECGSIEDEARERQQIEDDNIDVSDYMAELLNSSNTSI
jgi:hypothetical protein